MTSEAVDTRLGRLHVELDGDGPPAVLWHSLFVDSTTWLRLRPLLRSDRRLILIDGPGHGRSAIPPAGFVFDDCPGAALDVLDALDVREPVDWVGNAWGGHVGLMLGAHSPDRLRSLVTIATPAHALTRGERMRIVPVVWAYRLAGPVAPLVRGVVRVLLGGEFMKSRPADTDVVLASLRNAPKVGMLRAMQSVMLNRPDLRPLLPQIEVPTLMVVPRNDPLLTVEQVRAAANRLPHGAMVELDADGHVAPIMAQANELAEIIKGFWRDPLAHVVR